MIKLTMENLDCKIEAKGTRTECVADAIIAFTVLAEVVANAMNQSFDSAALFMYQEAVLRKKEEKGIEKETR